APADYHLQVEGEHFSLSLEGPVLYSRPSIDVLFQTAASCCGSNVIGVILTGANADGAAGARSIKERGGIVIVQDPATAEAPQMPAAAIAATAVDQILPVSEIAQFLVKLGAPARGGKR
ncbi:MAG TPA: chemotaxis protein CheB, partial [Thermoanaerobaculia bacterium]|nr:chemotaxis protein CheB [Thermoanaerobaculia bacterium]